MAVSTAELTRSPEQAPLPTALEILEDLFCDERLVPQVATTDGLTPLSIKNFKDVPIIEAHWATRSGFLSSYADARLRLVRADSEFPRMKRQTEFAAFGIKQVEYSMVIGIKEKENTRDNARTRNGLIRTTITSPHDRAMITRELEGDWSTGSWARPRRGQRVVAYYYPSGKLSSISVKAPNSLEDAKDKPFYEVGTDRPEIQVWGGPLSERDAESRKRALFVSPDVIGVSFDIYSYFNHTPVVAYFPRRRDFVEEIGRARVNKPMLGP